MRTLGTRDNRGILGPMTTTRSKAQSLALVSVAYVVAIAVAAGWLAWGPATGHLWLDTLIADGWATVAIFVFSRRYHNSSFYDAYWSVIPPLLTVYWWSQAGPGTDRLRCVLLTVVIMLWAIRLTANWVYSFPGLHHEDWRYGLLRQGAGRWDFLVDLFAIHLIPTLQVFAGMLPVYIAVTHPGGGLVWLTALAFVVGVSAVLIELVADVQLHRFAATRQPGQVLDRGLWGWSRHPNYFGEISFWFALALFGVAAAPGDAWWLFVGVLAMVGMFLGASIPMMEKRSLERRPDYQDVIDRVPRLVPRPARRTAT
jgi:steroid 5-alpha reductase family enzyme